MPSNHHHINIFDLNMHLDIIGIEDLEFKICQILFWWANLWKKGIPHIEQKILNQF